MEDKILVYDYSAKDNHFKMPRPILVCDGVGYVIFIMPQKWDNCPEVVGWYWYTDRRVEVRVSPPWSGGSAGAHALFPLRNAYLSPSKSHMIAAK